MLEYLNRIRKNRPDSNRIFQEYIESSGSENFRLLPQTRCGPIHILTNSTLNEEIEWKEKTRDDVCFNTFLAMHWLTKEEIVNKKFGSLLELLEQVGLNDMKFFQHRSAGSLREMFLLLGKVVEDTVTNPFSDVRSFGLLCDEANKEQLITFVKFVNPTTGKPNTKFLAASNLLEESTSANAATITNAILKQLEESEIDKHKLTSFSKGGASVMTDCIAAKLRSEIKSLINIHGICHRLGHNFRINV